MAAEVFNLLTGETFLMGFDLKLKQLTYFLENFMFDI